MLSLLHSYRRLFAVCACVAIVSGCANAPLRDPVRTGPVFAPVNVTKDPTLGGIRRVLLVPVWAGPSAPEETVSDLDATFRHALQKQNRFEVVVLSRAECHRRFGATAFSSAAALPRDLFPIAQRVFAADAVMLMDITVYRAYHPIALGIRARLAAVNNLRLVWSFDEVYSADSPLVATGARRFFADAEHQNVPGDLTPAVLQSPSRFAAYAAFTTFATLPPVTLGDLTQTSQAKR